EAIHGRALAGVGDRLQSDPELPSSRTQAAPAGVETGTTDLLISIKACYRTTKKTSICIVCGRKQKHMHMPIGRIGHFCEYCCPVCGKSAGAQPLATWQSAWSPLRRLAT